MKKYRPNHIPSETRNWYIFLSLVLLVYGTIGLCIDDLYLPGKRGRGVHLHGWPAGIMYLAFVMATLNMLSVVADHYDQRNNERDYRTLAKITSISGWSLFGIALVMDLFVKLNGF